MKSQSAAAGGAKMAGEHARSHRVLRTGADAADQTGGEKMIEIGCKTGGGNGESEQAVADAKDHAAANVGDDKTVGRLKDAAQGVVHGGERRDGDVAHAQFLHHQRINHAEHGGLKMVDEVGAADD